MRHQFGSLFCTLWVGSNFLYVCGHHGLTCRTGWRSFAVSLALFLLPGAAWFNLPLTGRLGEARQNDAVWTFAAWLVSILLASIVFQVATLAALITLGIHVTSALVWNVAWLGTNILFFARSRISDKGDAEKRCATFTKRSTVAWLG